MPRSHNLDQQTPVNILAPENQNRDWLAEAGGSWEENCSSKKLEQWTGWASWVTTIRKKAINYIPLEDIVIEEVEKKPHIS